MGGCLNDDLGPLRLWWDANITQVRLREGVPYSLEQYWPPETDWIEVIQKILYKYNLPSYHDLQEGVSEIVRILWSRNIFDRFDPARSSSFLIYFRGIVDNALNNLRVSRNRVFREEDHRLSNDPDDGEGSLAVYIAESRELDPSDQVAVWESLRKDLADIHSRLARRFSANLRINCSTIFASFEAHGIPNSKAGFLAACTRTGVQEVSGSLIWPHYRRECSVLVKQYFVERTKKHKGPEIVRLEVLGREGNYFVIGRGIQVSRVVLVECYDSFLALAGTGGRKGALDPSLRILNTEMSKGVVTEIISFDKKFR